VRKHLLCLLLLAAAPAVAGTADYTTGLGGSPSSAFTRPAFGLDPSRLSLSSTLSYSTSSGGQSHGLQVTSLSYQIAEPWLLQINLGSAVGPGTPGGSNLFLEGVNLSWRPSASTWLRVEYHDFRSPLQLVRPWGY
jgi:hypothetical protein